MYLNSYEDLIREKDPHLALERAIKRSFELASDEEQRLRIEVRSQRRGQAASRQEHRFAISPKQATVEDVIRILVERLEESPGLPFSGRIQINLSAHDSPSTRYGTFSRTIEPNEAN